MQAVKRAGGDLLLVARGGVVLPLDPGRDQLATARGHGAAGQPVQARAAPCPASR